MRSWKFPYTTSIPTGTDAGTYYVWYKVVADANHTDTEPASLTVTISPADKQVWGAEEAEKKNDIAECEITVKDRTYTGEPVKKPAVTVMYGKTKLKEGRDYTVAYNKKAKKIGAYKLTVSGLGKYAGEQTVTFNINPKGTTITSLTPDSHRITSAWEKQEKVTRYQLQYGQKKDFSDATTITVWDRKALAHTVRQLESGKTYYVRVRTYAKVKGKKFYSEWSAPKTVTTKGEKGNAAAEDVGDEGAVPGEDLALPGIDVVIDSGIVGEIDMDDGEIELTME